MVAHLEEASLNWKGILAIVAAAGIALAVGVWVGSCQGNSRFLQKDAERAALAELRRQEAQKHREVADTLTTQLEEASNKIESSRKALAASQKQTNVLKRKLRNRPKDTASCQDCEQLVKEQDVTLTLAYDTIFAQDAALKLCEQRDIERIGADERCQQAGAIERERLSSWKKQTRRGRVKTAFLVISTNLATGAAGYAIGRATQ